jgi:hypothetical protein
MLFCLSHSSAQSDSLYVLIKPVNYIQPVHKLHMDTPSDDIQLAGLYMEKAANQYKISRILYIAAAMVPFTYRLIGSGDNNVAGVVLVGSSAMGLVGLGFGFSGDLNLKKGSGILRRIQLQN